MSAVAVDAEERLKADFGFAGGCRQPAPDSRHCPDYQDGLKLAVPVMRSVILSGRVR